MEPCGYKVSFILLQGGLKFMGESGYIYTLIFKDLEVLLFIYGWPRENIHLFIKKNLRYQAIYQYIIYLFVYQVSIESRLSFFLAQNMGYP